MVVILVGHRTCKSQVRVLAGRHRVVPLGKLYLHLCDSVIKQCDLVPANRVRGGGALGPESNDSLYIYTAGFIIFLITPIDIIKTNTQTQ